MIELSGEDGLHPIPKFIDFGLSAVLYHGETNDKRYGTIAYSSPEVLAGRHHSHSTDVWSLGVVLYVMLSKEYPFLENDRNQSKLNIINGKFNFNNPVWRSVS
jgi:serine/threonine protein kinase